MPPLKNPRHELFAQFIAGGKTASESYIAAGFSAGKEGNKNRGAAQSASRLLRNLSVSSRIQELSSESHQSRATKAWLNREFVIEGLKRNYERAMATTLVLDPRGEPTGEYKYNGQVANRALELLGKELGMFVDRQMEVKDPLDYTPDEWDVLMHRFADRCGVPIETLHAATDDLQAPPVTTMLVSRADPRAASGNPAGGATVCGPLLRDSQVSPPNSVFEQFAKSARSGRNL